eukprot:gi/632962753/ref/XP_007897495.1/ PREDICTED: trace amine-associated receptor 2-like [Callorhinchus milii]
MDRQVIRSAAIYTVTYAVIIISTIITIVGNLEVIISIAHFKQLQTPTNYFILLLATTHFLIGLIILPYSMIAVDRYNAMCDPLLYITKITLPVLNTIIDAYIKFTTPPVLVDAFVWFGF